jgi:hypothetical protein
MVTNKRKPFLRFASVGGVLALRIVRFAAVAVAFILSAGMLEYSYGSAYLLVAFLAGFASFRLISYLYSRITRGLLTAPSPLDETLKTVYFLVAVTPANWFIFAFLAILVAGGFSNTDKGAEELNNFLLVRFWLGSIALIVLVTFGEIINRVGRHIRKT